MEARAWTTPDDGVRLVQSRLGREGPVLCAAAIALTGGALAGVAAPQLATEATGKDHPARPDVANSVTIGVPAD